MNSVTSALIESVVEGVVDTLKTLGYKEDQPVEPADAPTRAPSTAFSVDDTQEIKDDVQPAPEVQILQETKGKGERSFRLHAT